MLRASRAPGAELHEAAIPIAAAAVRRSKVMWGGPLAHALEDGEDHELLFALPPSRVARLARDRRLPAVARTPIGKITSEPGIRLRNREGWTFGLQPEGYEHAFAGDRNRKRR
jgi:thiamine monophosphate kinase